MSWSHGNVKKMKTVMGYEESGQMGERGMTKMEEKAPGKQYETGPKKDELSTVSGGW